MALPSTTVPRSSPSYPVLLCLGLSREGLHTVRRAFPEAVELQCSTSTGAVAAACAEVGSALLLIDQSALPEERDGRMPLLTVSPMTAIVAMCRSDDEMLLRRALAAGCAGVLRDDTPPQLMQRSIDAIREGELWFPRWVLSQVARRVVRESSTQRLTARELEILQLLGMEQKNQAIADKLFISRETVRWHLRALYSKLGVSSREAAQQYARHTMQTEKLQ